MPLTVRLTRLDPTHHRFEAIRADGSTESLRLETKTFLVHDLVHFAVESEAGLRDSFYGRLARGGTYAEFTDPAAAARYGGELLATEPIVGMLQGALRADRVDTTALHARFAGYHIEALGGPPPSWFTPDFLDRVVHRFRALLGHWRGTPFGQTMELRFET